MCNRSYEKANVAKSHQNSSQLVLWSQRNNAPICGCVRQVNRLSDPRQRPIPDVDRRMEMSINYPKGVLGSYAWNGEPIFLTKLQ